MKGWLDNFGKADNANESNVSMSEDFVGLGYDTKGRNYSPAWGGQFQRGGKLTPISPLQQVQQAVQATPTVPYLQTKDPAEFYKSWIQSPEYAKRQLLTGYSEGEDLYMPNAAASRESRLGAIEEMTPITYSARQPSEAKPGVYGSPSYVNINPSDYIDTSKEAIQAHELAHIAGAMGEIRPGMMSAKEQEIFKKSMLPMKEPVLSGVQGSKEREASKRALEDWKHSQEPDEAKADLDALRFMMYDKGIYDITKGKKFTETDFEKAKQNLGKDRVFKRLTDRVGKKNFVNLMNTIASADQEEAPIAMGGMSIPGSVGFSYARVSGAAPSKGKYAKKTMASAQKGKQVQKGVDSTLENIFEVVDPTGVSSWDDVYQSYQKSGMSPETKLEILGALPILGKVGKAGKLLGPALSAGQTNKRLKTNAKLVSNVMQSIPYIGRGTDATQAVQQFSDVPFFPTAPPAGVGQFGRYAGMPSMDLEKKQYGGDIPSAQNGQEMRFYQNGLDWKPKSMQDGGVQRISTSDPRYPELYKNRQVGAYYDGAYSLPDLDEVTVTAKRPSLYEDLRGLTKTVEETAAEFTGVPGTIRFSKDPVENIKGLIRTGDQTGLGLVGLLPGVEQTGFNYNDQDVESAFNTLDAFGLASGVAGLVRRPIKRLPELFSHLTSPIIEMKDFDPVRLKRFDRSDINTDELINQLNEVIDQRTPVLRGYEQDNRLAELSRNIPDLRLELTPIDVSGVRTLDDAATTVDNWLSANRLNSELPSDLESRFEDIFQRYSIPGLRSADDSGTRGKQALREIVAAIPNRITDYELSNLRQNYGNRAFRQQEVKNRSGLTKAETLSMSKDKDKVSKMDEQEFINTVVKPSGEVVEYKTNVDKVMIDPSSQRQVLKDQIVMSDREYADMFNDRLDLLNEIIDERNKSGVAYKVKKLTPEGKLIFETPEQSILNDEGALVPIRSGESSWSVNLNPGQWRGEVEDVANTDYYRSIPGLEMSNTSGTVFADRNPRRGTGAYESINEYLKKLDLGRVKPGFNSQTPFSKGAWENFVNSGKAFGYYGKPGTVYGSMKTILPIGFGASYLYNETPEFQNGGVTKDNQGYWNPENWGKPVEIDSNDITMEGVYEPLLGVSDTGDTKLMKPGKNYKFKGKKVTEFPVAKLGINQLDAQPMKKLNQLLNFTNNPDKDNWLDKYN